MFVVQTLAWLGVVRGQCLGAGEGIGLELPTAC